jgi:hypothetical protein
MCFVGVRRALLVTLVGGCGFQPGATSTGETIDAAMAASGHDAGSGSGTNGGGSDAGSASKTPDASTVGLWTCGSEPTAPSATVTVQSTKQDLSLTSIDLTGGEAGSLASGQLVVAKAGASMTLALDFTITDTTCTQSCVDQVEVGWVQGTTGPRDGCVWSGDVPEPNGTGSNVTGFTIKAPSAAGEYDLRTDIGQGNSCGTQTTWWNPPAPPAAQTLVKLCVQ